MIPCQRNKFFSIVLSTLAFISVSCSEHSQAQVQFEDELDAFAADVLNEAQEISFEEGVEYCGLIYELDGEIDATPPTPGEEDSCQPDDEPEGSVVLASYHTHGSYSWDADAEVPSVDDLEGDIDEGIDGYIATPGGRLWFNDGITEEAIMLCDLDCLISDPDFQECEAFLPEESYTLPELIQRAEEDTGEC